MPHFELRVDLDAPETLRFVITAEALARTIRGIPLPPAAWRRINRLNIVRTVRGTTGIEGARLNEAEVDQILAAPAGKPVLAPERGREEAEARNADAVMRFVATTLDGDPDTPLTEGLIQELHRRTTEGIPYEFNIPGQYRQHGATAGDYVPPRNGDDVARLMAEFVRWLNSGPVLNWPAVVRAVAAHFYFVSIHPFGDGNGRTARAIESFLLYQGKVNPVGFYSLANYYYINRSEYIRMLDFTRFESGNDLTPFLKFAAKGLVDELEIVHAEVVKEATLIAYRDFARETLATDAGLSPEARQRTLDFILALGEDAVPVGLIRSGRHPAGAPYRGVSERTLSRDLRTLEEHGLVVRDKGTVRQRREAMEHYRATVQN